MFASRQYEPKRVNVDHRVQASLRADGIEFDLLPGTLLYEPAAVCSLHPKWSSFHTPGHDSWGKLFPFWRACMSLGPPDRCLPEPELQACTSPPPST